MICQTNTQLLSENSVENRNLQPSNQLHEKTAVSEAVLKRRAYQRNWCRNNQEKVKAHRARKYLKSKSKKETPERRSKRLAYRNKWNSENRHKSRIYDAKKRKSDPQYMLMRRIRSRQLCAFSRKKLRKSSKTRILLECTIAEAKSHIESMFSCGMSWENRKSFVIDHHVPIAVFDLTNSEELLLAFCWRNLRPITQHENNVKADKVPSPLPDWLPPHIAQRILLRVNHRQNIIGINQL